MSLNWVMLDESKRPLPLPNEHTVMTVDKGAEVIVDIPDITGNPKKLKESGRIWLTEQRLIFVASPNTGNGTFESLSIPLLAVVTTQFVQPTFGANYLAMEIKPSPQGGLTDGTKAEVRLKDQGMFGFVSALEKVRERALYMKRQSATADDELPVYSSPSASAVPLASASRSTPSQGASGASQPTDAPPGYDVI